MESIVIVLLMFIYFFALELLMKKPPCLGHLFTCIFFGCLISFILLRHTKESIRVQTERNKIALEQAQRWEAYAKERSTPRERIVYFNDLSTGTVVASDADYPVIAQACASITPSNIKY